MATQIELVKEIIEQAEALGDNLKKLCRAKSVPANQFNAADLADNAFFFWKGVNLTALKKAYGIEE